MISKWNVVISAISSGDTHLCTTFLESCGQHWTLKSIDKWLGCNMNKNSQLYCYNPPHPTPSDFSLSLSFPSVPLAWFSHLNNHGNHQRRDWSRRQWKAQRQWHCNHRTEIRVDRFPPDGRRRAVSRQRVPLYIYACLLCCDWRLSLWLWHWRYVFLGSHGWIIICWPFEETGSYIRCITADARGFPYEYGTTRSRCQWKYVSILINHLSITLNTHFLLPAATIGAIVGGAAAGVVSSGKERGDPRILPVADIGDACIVIRPIWTKGKREWGYPYHKSHVSTNAIIAIDYLFRFGIHCWCSFTSPGQVICSITPWSFGGWHWCRYGFHVGTRLYQ